ncbi:MAG: hypothetical protein APG12_01054 [Candidatus Methanofastidiosum methylothiophilum]|uniref:Uncharacterized protein n=1 Tax=Candidatus Methanofastidiosum methylothiophilum TaxID=1705564 RepID=A0A150IL25_9EURY|nr:MAG: hypothetical protein APG10_00597 [Candidatus Methanofastidiosum methylthiophilus]KYC47914.1 MAG: hypothetical protein APG11_00793 [Candidatus Methanofastidiosum methylthiophilus]KYC50061.1 MAG: hypothetical protein APG12_01054 [Candidatus Methanofastidiosum methylthiophilus]
MSRGDFYIQKRLDEYLKSDIQEIIYCEHIENPYEKINCSLVSEMNVSHSYSYFRCDYRDGIKYPKTGSCSSCPLRNHRGAWIGVEIDISQRKEYLKSLICPQWLCFGIK